MSFFTIGRSRAAMLEFLLLSAAIVHSLPSLEVEQNTIVALGGYAENGSRWDDDDLSKFVTVSELSHASDRNTCAD